MKCKNISVARAPVLDGSRPKTELPSDVSAAHGSVHSIEGSHKKAPATGINNPANKGKSSSFTNPNNIELEMVGGNAYADSSVKSDSKSSTNSNPLDGGASGSLRGKIFNMFQNLFRFHIDIVIVNLFAIAVA